jgi:hypothetical protein
MSTLKKIKDISREPIKSSVSKMTEDERKLVLVWSENALSITQNKTLTKKEKILAIKRLQTPRVAKIFGLKVFEAIQSKTWVNQSWARRLGVVGLTVSGITFGGAGVGIATLGAGMGLPLMLLTAGGGVILGSVIDEIKKELK